MPTRDRPAFARRAVEYFLRQDYPNRELIVLDDGDDSAVAALAAADPRVRYSRTAPGESIGAKRNRGAGRARGEILVQWDDDDWHGPGRLTAQVRPILAGEADVTALAGAVWFDLPGWRFWKPSPALHRRLFAGDAHGGTLAFRRDVWRRLAKYPDRSLAEDALFLRAALARGARLGRVAADGLFVYVRHGANSWPVSPGRGAGWEPAGEPAWEVGDRDFYAGLSGLSSDAPSSHSTSLGKSEGGGPLVQRLSAGGEETVGTASSCLRPSAGCLLTSCIMPTADRRAFVARAVRCFLRQDYADRELVVVDDGADAVGDLLPPGDARFRYVRLDGPRRRTVGAKRNIACEHARGEVIVHWDDDDWSAPDRLTRQAAHLLAKTAAAPPPDVGGLARVYYHDPAAGRAWLYAYAGRRPWVAGNTLCYRRSLWRAGGFADVNVGEDARFLWSGRPKRVAAMADFRCFVATIHGGNVSPKRPGGGGSGWHPRPEADIRRLVGDEWSGGM